MKPMARGHRTRLRYRTLSTFDFAPTLAKEHWGQLENKIATDYLVQGLRLKGSRLVADVVKSCKTHEAAISRAERLGPIHAGVVAFSQGSRRRNRRLRHPNRVADHRKPTTRPIQLAALMPHLKKG